MDFRFSCPSCVSWFRLNLAASVAILTDRSETCSTLRDIMTDTIPGPVAPPRRILMGPGPSDIHPRVLLAMAAPTVGHLDPYFLKIMDETQTMLRQVFRT